MSPPSKENPFPSLPTPSLPGCHRGLALGALRRRQTPHCFTLGSVYVSVTTSLQLIPASLSPTSLFNMAKFSTFWDILYFIPSLLHQLFLYMLAEAIKWGCFLKFHENDSLLVFFASSGDDRFRRWGWGHVLVGAVGGGCVRTSGTLHIMKWVGVWEGERPNLLMLSPEMDPNTFQSIGH